MTPSFDPRAFFDARVGGHGHTIGIGYRDHGADWAELELPYDAKLVGEPATGVIASGPVLALMDMATAIAAWLKRGHFAPQATLDLRIDYLRAAVPERTVIGRGECYRVTRSIAFVRGQAHDGDPADPIAHVAGTFMLTDG
jgi:uncharacterized protein (TIGR00369 family)